ncbi:hypothetical protein O6H91_15G054600 [Diphasiastrum complanatum]|nr:hypothetical protein O6H91_Y397200 [Diphasiastrum complanatum]KAJ7529517.1 hypothetical protein O6H91_15G054600 [Diphasiastrum complanatum]
MEMLVLQVSCEGVISENMRKKPEKMGTLGCNFSTMTNLHQQASVSHIVREGSLGDFWQIADTHCGAFLPDTKFPMGYIFRCDRMMALLASFSLCPGQKRKYLVAIDNEAPVPTDSFQADFTSMFSFGFGVEEKVQHNHISGILTVDTLAEFLPRQKRTGRRRMGIAYISNVAVRMNYRRKGIAKKLVQEAEMVAREWGCRSIALHCDISNSGAVALYRGEGYKAVKVPAGAKWPKPKGLPDSSLLLMMKVLFVRER